MTGMAGGLSVARWRELLLLLLYICIPLFSIAEGQGFRDEGTYIVTLVSPNHPSPYPHDAQLEWTFHTPPEQYVLIRVNTLTLERWWDKLTVSHSSIQMDDGAAATFSLASSNVTSLFLPGGETVVSFCSDEMVALNGYALDVYSFDGNGTDLEVVDETVFGCMSGRQFIEAVARCDGFIDCHDRSDEIGCGDCEADYYRCSGSDICLLPRLQCDGVNDCPLGDDEAQCGTLKCPSDCSCGDKVYHAFLLFGRDGPLPPCGDDPDWLPFWVNCTSGWNQEYANHTAPKASLLILNGAPVNTLDVGDFYGLQNIHLVDLSSAQISYLPPRVFTGLTRAWKLLLVNNSLTYLENGTFEGLDNLQRIFLEKNQIARLDAGCFRGLPRVFILDFEYNLLTSIPPGAFKDVGNSLSRLIITNNLLDSLNASMFEGLTKLYITSVEGNPITSIEPRFLAGIPNLQDIRIKSRSTIRLTPDVFDGKEELKLMVANDPRVCCIAPESLNCITRDLSDPLFTCRKSFLQSVPIKTFCWILGISALVGNAFVFLMRLRTKETSEVASVQSIMISNLAIADFIMGVYLLILSIMDLYIGDSYFWDGRAKEWRSSVTCQVAGFISFLSGEASVFLLTLISVDRFICIMFPFSQKRLGVKSARIAVVCIWLFTLILSSISATLGYRASNAYSLSDVCVGFPLIRAYAGIYSELDTTTLSQFNQVTSTTYASSSVSTWQFSIAIFLGVNLVGFVVIVVCYIAIFFRVRFSSADVGKKKNQSANEIRMALKMSLIIGTDFFCWMPIIILGILVQAGVITLTPDIYAWLVVFILPINSALNPYIYSAISRSTAANKPSK